MQTQQAVCRKNVHVPLCLGSWQAVCNDTATNVQQCHYTDIQETLADVTLIKRHLDMMVTTIIKALPAHDELGTCRMNRVLLCTFCAAWAACASHTSGVDRMMHGCYCVPLGLSNEARHRCLECGMQAVYCNVYIHDSFAVGACYYDLGVYLGAHPFANALPWHVRHKLGAIDNWVKGLSQRWFCIAASKLRALADHKIWGTKDVVQIELQQQLSLMTWLLSLCNDRQWLCSEKQCCLQRGLYMHAPSRRCI